jgi:hypothetical protein
MARDGERVFWQTFTVRSTEAQSRIALAGEPPQAAHRAAKLSAVVDDIPRTVDAAVAQTPREIGGRAAGPDPTRFGDWELRGRCIDF